MAGIGADPDPNDPRVQEQIRDAVKQARGSALGSYMSQQDLANAASANLSGMYGSSVGTPEFTGAISHEVRRQAKLHDQSGRAVNLGPDVPPTVEEDDSGAPAPSVAPYATRDPIADLVIDDWLDDAEIYSLRHTAPYQHSLMQKIYDPSAPAEFYRGYAVVLVAVAKMIGPADSLQRYRNELDHIGAAMQTWAGTPDQLGGVTLALANAYEYSNSGQPVAEIARHVRGEIACIAECFYLARQRGLPDQVDAEDRVDQPGQAWQVLSDPDCPADYDAGLKASTAGQEVVHPAKGRDVIADAIERAGAGAKIVLQPGRYRESLILTDDAELIGDGSAADIKLRCKDGPCLVVQGGRVVIRGITLSGAGPGLAEADEWDRGAIRVESGELTLEGCRVKSGSGPHLAADGSNTRVILRNCQLYGSGSSALQLTNGAAAELYGCELSGGPGSDFVLNVWDSEGTVLEDCQVNAPDGAFGAYFSNSAASVISCSFSGGGGANVCVTGPQSEMTLTKCTLNGVADEPKRDGRGVWVSDGSLVTVTDCVIRGENQYGVDVASSQLDMRGCTVSGQRTGIRFWIKASGSVTDTNVTGCQLAALMTRGASTPTVRDATLQDSQIGVCAADGGKGLFEKLLITGCDMGVAIIDRSDPVISQSEITDCNHAVVSDERGAGTVADCLIHHCSATPPVNFAKNTTTKLRACVIR
jgi:Right handed beta helix region